MRTILEVALPLVLLAIAGFIWQRKHYRLTIISEQPGVREDDGEFITTNLKTPGGGMGVLLSYGPKRQQLPPCTEECVIARHSDESCVHECGHEGFSWFVLNTWGFDTKVIDDRKKCPECTIAYIKRYCIRCALCGHFIAPGSPVNLYDACTSDIRLDIATMVGNAVIGCLRWDCAPTAGLMAGHWTETGFKPKYADGSTAVEQAAATHGMVIENFD